MKILSKFLVHSVLITSAYLFPQETWATDILEKDMTLAPNSQAQKHEEVYRSLLKGVLTYRPQEESDIGRIDLPVAALKNPLEDTFDLSQCEDASKYLSISIGYRRKKKAENENKVEIWLTPRFLIEENLESKADHFKDILPTWKDTNPIGIFWAWGGWNNLQWYRYLISENVDEISNNNLFEKRKIAINHTQDMTHPNIPQSTHEHLQTYVSRFTFNFKN